jgi:hypothetical protein
MVVHLAVVLHSPIMGLLLPILVPEFTRVVTVGLV